MASIDGGAPELPAYAKGGNRGHVDFIAVQNFRSWPTTVNLCGATWLPLTGASGRFAQSIRVLRKVCLLRIFAVSDKAVTIRRTEFMEYLVALRSLILEPQDFDETLLS
jgi:hypothetical protein